jgi:mono/diheme cytochrome c family protein
MRYFLLIFATAVALVITLAGFRGDMSRRPPIEIFPDMDRQYKLLPQKSAAFFADGRSSRLPVEGTIARGAAFELTEINTGLMTGTTNYIENIPVPVTMNLLERGRQRYDISCAICHGGTGDGQGMTTRLGMVAVANLHDTRMVEMSDGELYYVIRNGRGLMPAYGPALQIEDRWAIVAYVRALQRSRLGLLEDVPVELQDELLR